MIGNDPDLSENEIVSVCSELSSSSGVLGLLGAAIEEKE